jgi:dUTP pyrophosphatase
MTQVQIAQLGEQQMTKNELELLADKLYVDVYRIGVEVMENGTLPCKAHKTDAGFDLFATEDVVVKNGKITKHPLNIKLELPEGTYAEITSKSGLGVKGLLVYAGIIDEGYRGVVHVVCTNHNDEQDVTIKKGEKIAQMIVHPYSAEYFLEQVEGVSDNTDRGAGGFGSTN